MLKVVIIGYGELGAALIKGIVKTKHQIAGVLGWDRRKHYSRFITNFFPEEMEKLRRQYKLPTIDVPCVNGYEFLEKMTALQPDIILIGSWGEILKRETIELAKKYCINCHPSYLPEHRGSNPYASAIVQGSEYSGVTFHEVDEKIDTGRILLQEKIDITQEDTGASLRDKCAYIAELLVVKLLDKIENNKLTPCVQDETKATYYPRLKAEDGAIDWNNSATTIHNQIRGLYPWIHCYAVYENKLVLIKKSNIVPIEFSNNLPGTILNVSTEGILVATGSPQAAVLLNDLQIFGLNTSLSRIYLNRILNVDKKFTNAL